MRHLTLATLLLCASLCTVPAQAANAVSAGQLIVQPPTLIALGFDWQIDGDDNRNARVSVQYRRQGDSVWRQGLDLLRLQREESFVRNALDYVGPNLFSGSVLDLQENTPYEVRFTLTDPDGVSGAAERTVTVRTRAEPGRRPVAACFTSIRRATPARASNRPTRACWRPTTWPVWAAIGAAPRRRGCAPATRSWCMPVST